MNINNENPPRSYISFENVRKTYRSGDVETDALKDVNFSANKGEFCVLLGSSGAGKTTLLNMLGGMDTVTEGKIFLGDLEVTALSPKELVEYRRFDVGFVFQFYNLIPNLTAKENVELAAMLCPDHLPAETALKLVGLEDRMDNFPSQLSGGEQQRVSIARALAKSPRLLLCDEPTGALDYQTGKNVLSLLYRLSKENGTTVVVITHNQAIAPMADRIIKIKNGSIEYNTVNENVLPIEEIEW